VAASARRPGTNALWCLLHESCQKGGYLKPPASSRRTWHGFITVDQLMNYPSLSHMEIDHRPTSNYRNPNTARYHHRRGDMGGVEGTPTGTSLTSGISSSGGILSTRRRCSASMKKANRLVWKNSIQKAWDCSSSWEAKKCSAWKQTISSSM
jgi:hypothetical protein